MAGFVDFDAHDDNMPVTDVVELTGVDMPDAAVETDPQVIEIDNDLDTPPDPHHLIQRR